MVLDKALRLPVVKSSAVFFIDFFPLEISPATDAKPTFLPEFVASCRRACPTFYDGKERARLLQR